MTLRRLIVFGVCAVGVASLHLLPSGGRLPHHASGPGELDEPTVRPSGRAVRDASSPVRPRAEASASHRTVAPAPSREPEADEPSRPRPSTADPTRVAGATAFDPDGRADEESPAAVAELTSAAVTPSRLSLRWPAARDNVGVVGYTVVLDGFEVATTSETSATVRWFNNDAREHIVQVRALDAAGNRSATSPNLLVARPTPAPSPTTEPSTPSPEPTPTPEPTQEPTPSSAPSASAPGGNADEPRSDPSPSEPAESPTVASAEAR